MNLKPPITVDTEEVACSSSCDANDIQRNEDKSDVAPSTSTGSGMTMDKLDNVIHARYMYKICVSCMYMFMTYR